MTPATLAVSLERLRQLIAMHGDDEDAAVLRALAQDRDAARAEVERMRAEVARWQKAAREWDEHHPAYIEGGRAARRAALEEAARACDARSIMWMDHGGTSAMSRENEANACAEVIRALAEPQR